MVWKGGVVVRVRGGNCEGVGGGGDTTNVHLFNFSFLLFLFLLVRLLLILLAEEEPRGEQSIPPSTDTTIWCPSLGVSRR